MAVLTGLKIGNEIGRGGFGVVHEGQHPVLGKVAVKIMRKADAASDAEWNQRKTALLKEAQRLRQAEHPHVVRVHDLALQHSDEEIYLVMEHMPGGALEAFYEMRPLKLSEVHRWMTDAALGLAAIHARGLIHRDIKPGNILVDQAGRARVADFGLVTDDVVHGYASLFGYKNHLAPECWSRHVTSVRTDIWAFGMTMYRLLHGGDFYATLPAPMNEVPQGGFSQKLRWLEHVPDEWRRAVRKCLHDDSAKRVQDSQQLLNILAGLPVALDWECNFSPDVVIWERDRRGRNHRVTKTRVGRGKYEWAVESRPAGGGDWHCTKRGSGKTADAHRALTQILSP